MGFKPLNTNAIDIKDQVGKSVVGTYTGKKEITTQLGKQVIWQFLDEDEQPWGCYGFTNLNRAMEMIKPGTLCRITYKGTLPCKTKFGLKDVHQVLVEIDDHEEAEGQPVPRPAQRTPVAVAVPASGVAQEKMPWDGEDER